jgi:hypothetical protein
MGCGAENITKTYTESATNIMQNVMMEYVNEHKTEFQTEQSLEQTAQINLANATMLWCKVTIDQKAHAELVSMMQIDASTESTFLTTITQKLEELVESSIKQVNSGLNISQSNDVDLTKIIKTDVASFVSTKIKNAIENIIKTSNRSSADARIDAPRLFCLGSDLVIKQDAALRMVAQNLVKSVIDSVADSTIGQDIAKKISDKVDQSNEGLSMMGLILLVVCVILCLLGGGGGGGVFGIAIVLLAAFMFYRWSKDKKN